MLQRGRVQIAGGSSGEQCCEASLWGGTLRVLSVNSEHRKVQLNHHPYAGDLGSKSGLLYSKTKDWERTFVSPTFPSASIVLLCRQHLNLLTELPEDKVQRHQQFQCVLMNKPRDWASMYWLGHPSHALLSPVHSLPFMLWLCRHTAWGNHGYWWQYGSAHLPAMALFEPTLPQPLHKL